MLLNILCNDSAKNLKIEINENENLKDLKTRLGSQYSSGKWVYAGKLLDENEALSAIVREENPNIHLFVTEIKMVATATSESLNEKSSEKVLSEQNDNEDLNESKRNVPSFSAPKKEAPSLLAVEPDLIGLPTYSTEPLPVRIVIINGQKYKIETGDPIPIPDGLNMQEVRRRMATSLLQLHLSGGNVFEIANEENNRANQVPINGNLNNNFRIYRAINVQINLNQWADIFGQFLKLLIACYFVTRYLSVPRAVIACSVFTIFFLHGIGFFQFLRTRFFPNHQPEAAPQNDNAPVRQHEIHNEQPTPLNGQDRNVPATPLPQQQEAPQTLLSIVQAAIIGFFVSMLPENIPQQRVPEEPDNAL